MYMMFVFAFYAFRRLGEIIPLLIKFTTSSGYKHNKML